MAWLIVQRFKDGRQGRMYAVRPFDGAPNWDATITVHAEKFRTYAQALAALEEMPDWMREICGPDMTPKIEPCRDPIHSLK